MMISKKHLQQTETTCAIFKRGPQKKGGSKQLPHSSHPISTLSPTSGVLEKKKGRHSELSSDLSIFVSKFFDLPITCAITKIFYKSSAALLGFSKFRGTKQKCQFVSKTQNYFRRPRLGSQPIV